MVYLNLQKKNLFCTFLKEKSQLSKLNPELSELYPRRN